MSIYSIHRFLYISDKWKNGPELVNDHISQYLHSPHPSNSDDPTTFINHIADMPYCSEKEQVMLLSSISNYHWLPTPGISTDKMSKDTTS